MAYGALYLDLMKIYFILVCVCTFLTGCLCLLDPRSGVLGTFVKCWTGADVCNFLHRVAVTRFSAAERR